MAIIAKEDLPSAIQAAEMIDMMIDGANARAARVAPCLASLDPEPSDEQLSEARLVIIGALRRWVEAGSGAFQQQTAGPFSVSTDTRQRTGYNFWPSEITQLQDICKDKSSGAFGIDTIGTGTIHSPICALAFGALYCSCAAVIAGFPLYEDVEP